MKRNKKIYNFEDFDYTPIEDVALIDSEGAVIKTWIRSFDLENPFLEGKPGGKKKFRASASFKNGFGRNISTDYFSKNTYKELRKHLRKGRPIEVLAEVYQEPAKGDIFMNELKILKYRSGDSSISQLQASRKEIELVKRFLILIYSEDNQKSRWGLLHAIREAIIEELKIVGIEMDELYSDSLDTMICQAFSGGIVNNTNGKINTCIVGPPATGKKLLWETAKFINPISQEAQNMRVTPAGITAGMSKNLPLGTIPLASKGVFGIQDFDKCKKSEELLPIFADVMEDKKVIISGVVKAELDAETAIHIDLNRFSDLYLKAGYSKNVTEDTGLPTNIISRFDFIVELKKDLNLLDAKAQQILLSKSSQDQDRKSEIGIFCSKNGVEVDRFLKLIVGYVMDEIDKVNIKPVQKYMASKFSEIKQENKENIDKMPEIASFQIRLANSLMKFVNALTRIQMLQDSNKDAVDKALHLLSRKLDFLKNIDEDYVVPNYRATGFEAFQGWLAAKYGSGEFAPVNAIKEYRDEGSRCGEKSDRALRYWIKKSAHKIRHGVWKVQPAVLKKYGKAISYVRV
ncbi:hypothetical protein D1BOALGB6SA_8726 [Olavius sp. associated proteobacterium Delta 1]|nr:hypothetical protein D1BOALGB6SA_8726 [Olavius sp. associated proteobacterium Delta 1]